MTVFHATLSLTSHGGTPSFIDVTDEVRQAVTDSGISNGICAVMSPHTTCSVYYDEWAHDLLPDGTDFLQHDLDTALGKIVPEQREFPPAHGYHYPGEEHFLAVESWPSAREYLPGGDRSQLLNADAHLKANLMGSSQVFPVVDGSLAFGITGYIFFVDWDRARERTRKCQVTVIGE
ncbi:MAG: YjbQ family protein [Tessaracoccus sp.]|uniref:YjbQ family protein n=1 Tax=Tessaracoccus sp. TaxID=1971211 RepID=UPI001EB7BDE5|nr:YjbQ family protein [Tessaracoccus sp.]MBK7819925.1 YjbQ family protein [Tessaracoccus sp.]